MLSSRATISVRGLGKSYTIRHEAAQTTLAEELLSRLRNPFSSQKSETFWALRDVSFDIEQGEIVGLIGQNGAGKSTLLKILARITAPTAGEAQIRGRMGSLIEVGTGFHLELTGRENIFLNGAILGMRRREIAKRFDEIVDFSGVERFLDTPVKRYSSGMFVRLAFAVAAHLDTDILLVDEVLAVGDAEFQKKSLGKLDSVANSGRTVLFVSHNLATLEALCNRGLLFKNGRLEQAGSLQDVLAEYRKSTRATGDVGATEGPMYLGNRCKYLQSIDIVDERGNSIRHIPMGTTLRAKIRFHLEEPIDYPIIALKLDGILGQRMLVTKSPTTEAAIQNLQGTCEVTCEIDALPFAPGEYTMRIGLAKGGAYLEHLDEGLVFTVTNADTFNDGWGSHNVGMCAVPSRWRISHVENNALPEKEVAVAGMMPK